MPKHLENMRGKEHHTCVIYRIIVPTDMNLKKEEAANLQNYVVTL
jgi:hypothetical protein